MGLSVFAEIEADALRMGNSIINNVLKQKVRKVIRVEEQIQKN